MVIPNPLQNNPDLVMPRFSETHLRSTDQPQTERRLSPDQPQHMRVRKPTPMVMPQHKSDKVIAAQASESITEEESEQETESEQTTFLVTNVDGTFVLPKLNKVEVGPKQEFKTVTIKVDLKHHLFESKPLETSDEPTSCVILGRPFSIVVRKENEKIKKRKTLSKTVRDSSLTLALIDEIISEVDRRYLFLNVFYYCSFSIRYNPHIICLYSQSLLYYNLTRVSF